MKSFLYFFLFSFLIGNLQARALHPRFKARMLSCSKAVLLMDSARQSGRVDLATALFSAGEVPFRGSGVIVGVVDVGFDLAHPAFFAEDGTYRVLRFWDQNRKNGSGTARFSYGEEFVGAKNILSAERDSAEGSHGTHVSGIAAGSRTGSPYYGVASDADLVLVSTSLEEKDILDGVCYIADYARSVSKPCVINLSIGGRLGPHDGTSAFDRAIDSLVGPGVLVVGAAGNDGDGRHHAMRAFSLPTDTLQLRSTSSQGFCYVDIWGEKGRDFRVRATLKNSLTGETLFEQSQLVDAALDTSYEDTLSLGKDGFAAIYLERDSFNDRPHATVACYVPQTENSLRYLIQAVGDVSTSVHAWAAGGGYFDDLGDGSLTSDHTVMEIGGTGRNIISVGMHVTKKVTPYKITSYSLYDLNPDTSRGPTLDGRRKPDVSAPGSLVVSAISRFDAMSCAAALDTVSREGINFFYACNQGTSMAAPFVTGVVALWLQANRELTINEVREILNATSWQDVRVNMSDGNAWGAGKIDALAGLRYIWSHFPSSVENIQGDSSIAELYSPLHPTLVFLQSASRVSVVAYRSDGTKLGTYNLSAVERGNEIKMEEIFPLVQGLTILQILTSQKTQNLKLFKIH